METTTSMLSSDRHLDEQFPSTRELEESARLEALRRYYILDTEPDPALQNLVALAAQLCGTEQGAVNLIDADRQWQAVTVGCPREVARREDSYCHVTIKYAEPVVVPDARDDARFADLPYTTGELGALRTYAGVQLVSPEGFNLGTLCVFDDRPDVVKADAVPVLQRLAVQAMALLEARRNAALLTRTEQMFRLAFTEAPIGFAMTGLDGRFQRVNPAFAALTGRSTRELLGISFEDLTHPDDLAEDQILIAEVLEGLRPSYRVEKRYVHRDGHAVWVEMWGALVRDQDGTPAYFIKQVQDISARKQLERGLVHQATHDALTGLPNRLLLGDRIQQALALLHRGGATLVLSLDLDRFKPVNDTYGHAAGDEVLREVAARMLGCVRRNDTVCRVGGDEFVIVAHDESGSVDHAHVLAARIIAAMEEPVTLGDGARVSVGLSIGGVVTRCALHAPSLLVGHSDDELYRAKRQARGSVQVSVLD